MYTAEEIKDNYEKLINFIHKNFEVERRDQLLNLHESLGEERIAMAPASAISGFHNSYAGGYIAHVLNVISCIQDVYDIWEKNGAPLDDFTREEMLFVALVHDLGKLGNEELENYLPNPSDWHVKNQGKIYIINEELALMPHAERSLYMLQRFGIRLSEVEYISIRIHDGAFLDSNNTYLKSWNPKLTLKSELPTILHHADSMATRIEKRADLEEMKQRVPSRQNTAYKKQNQSISKSSDSASDVFKDLFGDKEE